MKKLCMTAAMGLLVPVLLVAQTDTIERNVVVEREFQPVIRHAGKLNTPLQQVETAIEPVELQYSDYSHPLDASFNVKPLGVSTVRFTHMKPRNGHLTLGGGYPLSTADFGYRINHKKVLQLDLFGSHHGQWGLKTWSDSRLGLSLLSDLEAGKITFQVDGSNLFYSRYGRYYAGDRQLTVKKFKDLKQQDLQNLWTINGDLGFRSAFESAVQIQVEAGYTAFIVPDVATESIVRSHLWLGWQNEEHAAAFHIRGRNAFYAVNDKAGLAESDYNNRHSIRFEPYYEYRSDYWHVHTGVNIDLNIGSGRLLSGNNDLSFAPSPNVEIEYRIVPSWLAVYATAKGAFGYNLLQDFMLGNTYLDPLAGLKNSHKVDMKYYQTTYLADYTPLDAAIGFKIKPVDGFLIDLYGGYAIMNNQKTLLATSISDQAVYPDSYISFVYADYRRWKAGAEITYHYQDIVHILLGGNYYHWSVARTEVPDFFMDLGKQVFDRPAWDAKLRIDVNINSKWTIYSDNTAIGQRKALLSDETVAVLKPVIDLRLGLRYNMNRWLSFYGQLNNYLHRFNDIYYGYQSQGINGEIGLTWLF